MALSNARSRYIQVSSDKTNDSIQGSLKSALLKGCTSQMCEIVITLTEIITSIFGKHLFATYWKYKKVLLAKIAIIVAKFIGSNIHSI